MTQDQALVLTQHEQSLQTPFQETEYAQASAKQLMAIVRANGWARKFGGQSEHLQFEAWQTVGKYYSLAVDTDQQEVEYVDYGGVWGFKAHAQVIDTKTGLRVGGASALCMSDEANWKSKPKFQLASMAQTRAGSKALRQILAFVVALAGFSPTPYEEMVEPSNPRDDAQNAVTQMRIAKKKAEAEKSDVEEKAIDEWNGASKLDATAAEVFLDDEDKPKCLKCGKVLTEKELKYSSTLCYIDQKS